jgi:hypothetical protein
VLESEKLTSKTDGYPTMENVNHIKFKEMQVYHIQTWNCATNFGTSRRQLDRKVSPQITRVKTINQLPKPHPASNSITVGIHIPSSPFPSPFCQSIATKQKSKFTFK